MPLPLFCTVDLRANNLDIWKPNILPEIPIVSIRARPTRTMQAGGRPSPEHNDSCLALPCLCFWFIPSYYGVHFTLPRLFSLIVATFAATFTAKLNADSTPVNSIQASMQWPCTRLTLPPRSMVLVSISANRMMLDHDQYA